MKPRPTAPGVPLGAYGAGYYLRISCPGCQRSLAVTFAAAAARFGADVGMLDLARRLRCRECGRLGMSAGVNPVPNKAQAAAYGCDEVLDRWPD